MKHSYLVLACAVASTAAWADGPSVITISPGSTIEIPGVDGANTTVRCSMDAIPAGPVCHMSGSQPWRHSTGWRVTAESRVGTQSQVTPVTADNTRAYSFDEALAALRQAESDGICVTGAHAQCVLEPSFSGGSPVWDISVVFDHATKGVTKGLFVRDASREAAGAHFRALREAGVCAGGDTDRRRDRDRDAGVDGKHQAPAN